MRRRTIAGVLIFAAVLAYLFVPAAMKLYKLKRQDSRLEREIEALSTRNLVLQNEFRLLREDPIYIEQIARKTFRKAKDGEIVYRLVEPEEL